MYLKHRIAIFFCLACSFFWIPHVYQITERYLQKKVNLNSRVNFTAIRDVFPDIYMIVFIDNRSLDLPFTIPKNDRENPAYIDFITNLTIGEIGNSLRDELKSFSMYISNPNLCIGDSVNECPVTYYTDGFEIFIKISCIQIPYHNRRSLFKISHNISTYSLILTEHGSMDSLYFSHRNDITSMTRGQEEMLISVGKHTKFIYPPPDGPICENRTQHSFHDCKTEESERLLQSSFELATVVPLFDETFDSFRMLYLNSSTKTALNFSGCKTRVAACRYVSYDTTPTILGTHLNESSLTFVLDRSMDVQCHVTYDFTWPEYVFEVIEIVSIWLGFSVLSILTLMAETCLMIVSYIKSTAISKFNRVFPNFSVILKQ